MMKLESAENSEVTVQEANPAIKANTERLIRLKEKYASISNPEIQFNSYVAAAVVATIIYVAGNYIGLNFSDIAPEILANRLFLPSIFIAGLIPAFLIGHKQDLKAQIVRYTEKLEIARQDESVKRIEIVDNNDDIREGLNDSEIQQKYRES